MKKRFLSLALALVLAFVPAGMAADVSGLKEIVPADKYELYSYLGEGMIRISVYESGWGYKYGLIDTSGQEILAPKYDFIDSFTNGAAVVMVKTAFKSYNEWEPLYGLIDTTGQEIVAPKYDFIEFSEGLAVVRVGDDETGRWGVIDAAGKEIAALKYNRIWKFKEGAAPVRLGDKYGFIDTTGKEIVAPAYDGIEWFTEGLAAIRVGGGGYEKAKWGFVDKTGKVVAEPQYHKVGYFSGGLAPVIEDFKTGLVGFIDMTGQMVISPRYDGVYHFSNDVDVTSVRIGEKWGVIDKTGEEVIVQTNYDQIYNFSDRGVAAIRIGGSLGEGSWNEDARFGIIDKTGKEIAAPKYSYIWFGSDVVGVLLDGKCGLIDYTGREIAPLIYDYISDFSDGVAIVRVGDFGTGKCGLIDMTGKVLVEPKFRYIDFRDGLAVAYNGTTSMRIVFNTEGKEVFSVMGRDIDFMMLASGFFEIITGSLLCVDGALLSLTSAQAEDWAVGNIDYAISMGLVPPSLRSDYTSQITRAEVCALTVALYETITGEEITERKSFPDDGGDVNIQKLGGLGIVNGNTDGTFTPDGQFDRQTMAAITVNLVEKLTGATLAESASTFTDISQAEGWAQGHISKVQKAGLMNGSGDGTFDPLKELDRQMAVSLMKNLYEKYK